MTDGCYYYWLLWNSNPIIFLPHFAVSCCVSALAHLSARSANAILRPVLWAIHLALCLHTWVMGAPVEQGVQIHAELRSNGSTKSRCVLNNRGLCRVGFFGWRGWNEATDASVSIPGKEATLLVFLQLHAEDIYLLCFKTETLSNMLFLTTWHENNWT